METDKHSLSFKTLKSRNNVLFITNVNFIANQQITLGWSTVKYYQMKNKRTCKSIADMKACQQLCLGS